jgi:hypothetical protein
VFADLVELWDQYVARISSGWSPHDARHQLSAEVKNRLGQLDLILEYLKAALAVIEGNPTENAGLAKKIIKAAQLFRSKKITEDQYTAFVTGLNPKSSEQVQKELRAWQEVTLFTESFYFFAWRVREVLRAKEPFGFMKLKAHGIRDVRNRLLEHPEKHEKNFDQSLIVTTNGPALKTTTFVVRAGGRSEPANESVDRGLFVNAREFHDELLQILRKALP